MTTNALIFMLTAWTCVLGLLVGSYVKLLRTDPKREATPPPGTTR